MLAAFGYDDLGRRSSLTRYDEYGVPHGGNIGRFQYTGQAWLPEIGLYHYKARMYDPAAGRFLQPDPIGYDDGMNMQAYVGGDPVNLTDPTGLSPQGDLDPPTEEHCIEGCNSSIIITGSGRKPGTGQSGSTGWGRGSGGGGGGGGGGDDSEEIIINGTRDKRKKPAKPGHFFINKARVCTAAPGKPCHIERTNTPACVVPGRISTRRIRSGSIYAVYPTYSNYIPNGFVRTTVTGPNSYRNTTTWAHPLSGTIDRVFRQDSAGNIDVTTTGQGTATTALQDYVNQKRGPGIFEQQNTVCSAILGGQR